MIDTVIHNDCLTVLRDMADNSVDAIVSDPPGNLSFMGKSWDTFGHRSNFIRFMTEVFTEAKRVIKPGGHALIWALPRTSHWTATALEDAGFEVRDKLYHLFGSGFPKSTAIDKQIDKMLGKEREVIGPGQWAGRGRSNNLPVVGYSDENNKRLGPSSESMETKPATPEAQRWQGYGTALKPSCEEWILCRKPLAESSIAAQVLATGTGGLNIDANRINPGEKIAGGGPSWGHCEGVNEGWKRPAAEAYVSHESHNKGRFPSHLLLSHSLWCVPRGTKRVLSNRWGKGNERHGKDGESIFNLGKNIDTKGFEDVEGYEYVEAWECAPDCPIAELDRQSGVLHAPGTRSEREFKGWQNVGELHKYEQVINDKGGASRYFQHFPPEDYTPFLYQSKASRAERNKGCEDLPLVHPFDRETSKNFEKMGSKSTPSGNSHPTVKSLALCRWLIRLITPPDGIVLDPFCGSGSTCVAAIAEGKHFIGIEQDASYVAICEARIEYARTHEPDVVQVATKKVKANGGNVTSGTTQPKGIYNLGLQTRSLTDHRDQDGMEEVEDWECAPDCPVRILGEQSGELHARGNKTPTKQGSFFASSEKSDYTSPINPGDTGTAARYFQTFAPDLWTQDMHDAEEVFIAEGGYDEEEDCSPIEEVP